MIDTLYIETAVQAHPRVTAIQQRFPQARVVSCERYGEVFNPKAQNFRLQKQRPALILAEKYQKFVLPAPAGYGIGGQRNYYFSHILNMIVIDSLSKSIHKTLNLLIIIQNNNNYYFLNW